MSNELRLPLDELHEREGWNVRLSQDPDNITHINELAESIAQVGVLEPLTVYADKDEDGKTKYIIINGHCRFAAARIAAANDAPIKNVPVRVVSKRDKEADHTFGMIARNSGKQLSPLELGIACRRLIGFGWSETDLAEKTGKTIQTINNALTLASAPAEITKLVETGHVSATLAVQTIAAEGDEAGAVLGEAVEIARAEDEAKAAEIKAKTETAAESGVKRRGRPAKAAKPEKGGPVKATAKHVAKTKKKLAANYGNKNQLEPVEDIVNRLRAMPIVQALLVFDKLTKSRGFVFDRLLNPPEVESGDHNEGNGSDPDLTTLGLIFGRVESESSESGTTIVIDSDDWGTACRLLKIEQQPAEAAEAAAA